MDNITIIAIVSIITAGLTTGIGCMLPAFSEGKAGAIRLGLYCTATGRFVNHYENFICRIGHDRINSNLLFCSVDDPHFCQPFLESHHCKIKRHEN